jgi:predicted Zn-dependent protease with MMP-like domain
LLASEEVWDEYPWKVTEMILADMLLSVVQMPTPSRFGSLSDNQLLLVVLAIAVFFGLFWLWNMKAKKWLEQTGRLEEVPTRLDCTARGSQHNHEAVKLRYSEQEFQGIVSKALDEVPEEFDKEWKNVAVIVSTDWLTEEDKKKMGVPEGRLVLGTYQGFDKTKGFQPESSSHVATIFQPALEAFCGSDKERLEREIRRTVLHELAHHLGMSHQKMKEIGL